MPDKNDQAQFILHIHIIKYSTIVNETLNALVEVFNEFDFKIIRADVIGTILENLVPKNEKQKLGQYFTSEILANLVAFPAIQTKNDIVFDPTSGAGTFLTSFYYILAYHGNTNHSQLLNQIWGNDISHFPAFLSVINLYKLQVDETNNFPRVIREDFFNLEPGNPITFPDPKDYSKQIQEPIPLFESVISNFPFVQQEDIPNKILTDFFRHKFQADQRAFLLDGTFKINERADYFTYCIYNSFRFLKAGGHLSVITSNAWLGKEYGIQFKKFLLDNFHIKYIVRSNAEHWFSDSRVTTIYMVLQKGKIDEATKFITLNFKLKDYLEKDNVEDQLKEIEKFYAQIDNCQDQKNKNWKKDPTFDDLYHEINNRITVNVVKRANLTHSLSIKENWSTYFVSADLFLKFDKYLTCLYPTVINSFRGARTGWNQMFIIPANRVTDTGIESKFLIPYIKSPKELKVLEFTGNYNFYLFVCSLPLEELKKSYPGAYKWIMKFKGAYNTNGEKTIEQASSGNKPYWYSLRPKTANIVTAINPYERYFFSYAEEAFTIDQRLIPITIKKPYDVELIAALLNSVITFLIMEMRGTSRSLGSLDLNADYFKSIRLLNPNLLSEKQIHDIKEAFATLKDREIETVFEEVKRKDRKEFDKVVLKSFGIDTSILEMLYQTLISAVDDRVTLKEK